MRRFGDIIIDLNRVRLATNRHRLDCLAARHVNDRQIVADPVTTKSVFSSALRTIPQGWLPTNT
jgi:hypothetical protein